MEQRSEKGVGYFTAEGFKGARRHAVNAFTTRIGGVSPAPFNTLDFGGTAVGSTLTGRAQNISRLGLAIGVAPLRCAFVAQVHSGRVVTLGSADERAIAALARTEADAIVTVVPGVALGVLTADCLPVLLHDPVTGAVAAVHAGWRGTFSRIVKKTVGVMVKEYGVCPEDIRAALGACIGVCCYTVNDDFLGKFLAEFGPSIKGFFITSEKGSACNRQYKGGVNVKEPKLSFDLRGANRAQLFEAGVQAARIDSLHKCTLCNPDLFFSYRRDVTGEGGAPGAKTGRMLSMVMASAPGKRSEV